MGARQASRSEPPRRFRRRGEVLQSDFGECSAPAPIYHLPYDKLCFLLRRVRLLWPLEHDKLIFAPAPASLMLLTMSADVGLASGGRRSRP